MVDDSHNIRDIHKSVVVHIAFLVFFLNPIEGNRSAGGNQSDNLHIVRVGERI